MPNGFTAAPTAVPGEIADGGTVDVTLFYEYAPIGAEPDPEVQISCSAEFAIAVDPPVVTLPPAANGSTSLRVTIRRAGQHPPTFCTLVFNALHDERQKAITVTP